MPRASPIPPKRPTIEPNRPTTTDSIRSAHVTWPTARTDGAQQAFSRWRCAAVIENTL
jgi:hypothetical protein